MHLEPACATERTTITASQFTISIQKQQPCIEVVASSATGLLSVALSIEPAVLATFDKNNHDSLTGTQPHKHSGYPQ
jgi:hypothetical protein